jgi:3-isopropylmalate dehydrogenase
LDDTSPPGLPLCVAVLEGDGIGPEVMAPTLPLLRAVAGPNALSFERLPAGAGHYEAHGTALPEETMRIAAGADAILLGAMGLPGIRYPDGTEVTPQIELRKRLDLYAGVRPVTVRPGQPCPLRDERAAGIDFVLVRESTEGLFHSHGRSDVDAEGARETLQITRATSERLFDFALDLAARRRADGRGPGRVTCVDKANVFAAFAFFRGVFEERAALRPDLAVDAAYVDAMAMRMVREPWTLDVLVTENMFGDILSDLGAGLMGGLGFAPSADIGDANAVFQPCHGTAPDIAGRGHANPAAMILSAAMMLDWLGARHDRPDLAAAGGRLRDAVSAAVASGEAVTRDAGGTASTEDFAGAVEDRLG